MGPLPHTDLDEALALVGDWGGLRGARLFLTGGTGFFGRWLLETLVHADRELGLGVQATVLSRDPAGFLASTPHLASTQILRFLAGDIRNLEAPTARFTHILHGAAATDARLYQAAPQSMRETIVEGTRRVLALAEGGSVERCLFLSSGAVYGPQPPELSHFPEDQSLPSDTQDPGQAYAQGKREAERLCAEAQERCGFTAPVARCFAFVGPHLPLDQHFAIGNFLRDGLAGGPIRISGDGTPRRSYLYASELAAWLWALLLRGRTRTYHVGSDRDLDLRALAEQVADRFGTHVEIAQKPDPTRPPQRYVPAITRIPEDLGLRQTVDLSAALERTLAWHRAERRRAGHSG